MEQSEDHTAVEQEEGWCCCMCGDVGFSEHLLPCPVCHTRLQHTYCSRMYPEIEVGRWRCEWCLHKDYEHQQHQQQHSATPTRFKKQHQRHGNKGGGKHGSRFSSGYSLDSLLSRSLKVKERHHPETNRLPSRCGRGVGGRAFVVGNKTVNAKKKHQQQQQQESSSLMPSPASRCNPDRWRKPSCNSSSPRVVGRRYKLLADVLC